jgi:sugar phosphate isomerase/epimerase
LRNDEETENILAFVENNVNGNVGIEIFPLCHADGYMEHLDKFTPWLRDIQISFHEPYYNADHSKEPGSPEYLATMEYCKRVFEYASVLEAKYVVCHLNNSEISDREDMIAHSLRNISETAELARSFGLRILIENAGIPQLNNVLFGQDEFIGLFRSLDHDCLLDVGHANCSGWETKTVVRGLADRIMSYHLHNNYGTSDEHNGIFDGNFDMEFFFDCYTEYTPSADIVLEYRPELLQAGIGWLAWDIAYVQDKTLACSAEKERTGLAKFCAQ